MRARNLTPTMLATNRSFDRLIADASRSLLCVAPDDVDQGIAEALRLLGEFARASHSGVLMVGEPGGMPPQFREWTALGTRSLREPIYNLTGDDVPWLVDQLLQQRRVAISRLADLPHPAQTDARTLSALGIGALLLAPSRSAGSRLVVGLAAAHELAWGERCGAALEIVAAMIAAAIERQRTEAHLQRARLERRTIFQAIPDLFFHLSADGTIVDYDAGQPSDLYLSPEQFLGRPMDAVVPGTVGALFKNAIAQVNATQAQVDIEYQLPFASGSQTFTARLAPFAEREILILVRNVSEARAAQQLIRQAEQNYRSIYENAIEGIFQTTPDGHYISANPALARIYGYASPEELIASLTDIAGQLYVDPTRRLEFSRMLRERDTVEAFESQVYRQDGRVIWIAEKARAVRDAEGHLLYYEGTVEDVTQRKQAESALERSRRKLEEEAHTSTALARVGREVISLLSAPLILDRICRLTTEVLGCDCSHTILRDVKTNEYRVVSAYGYTQEQSEALRVLQMPPDVFDEILDQLKSDQVVQVVLNQRPSSRADNLSSQYGVSVSLYAALRRGNEIAGVHVAGYRGRVHPFGDAQIRIAAGIAQQTSMALENARLVSELERASRLKSDFVATMSHELRTPLNVILGYSELLLDGTFGRLPDDQCDVIRRLDDHACQLLALINTMLDLGRLDAGRMPVESCVVDLDALIQEVDAETRSLRDRPNLEFHWRLPEEMPSIHTDPLKLKVVLKNLIGNAVKFTPHGNVMVAVEPCDDGILFSVSDSGIGISAEALPVIFEAFRQGDSSPTRRYDGAGLGLYIVSRLLEVMGGRIEVDSCEGHGSTFRVWIPPNLPATAVAR